MTQKLADLHTNRLITLPYLVLMKLLAGRSQDLAGKIVSSQNG